MDSTPTQSLRGGDASSSYQNHSRNSSNASSASTHDHKRFLYFNRQGESVLDFSAILTPAEIPKMAEKVKEVGEKLSQLPTKLEEHQNVIDTTSVQAVGAYAEILDILRNDIENNRNSAPSQKEDSLEAIDLLKEQFEVVSDLCHESQEFTKTHIAKYRKLLHEEFNAALALEHANIHNDLAMYQHNWTQQQVDYRSQEQYTVAELHRRLSNLTLRSGLMVTEKQAAEESARLARDNVIRINKKVLILENEKAEYHNRIAEMSKKLEEEVEKSRALTSANLKLEEEHHDLKEDLNKLLSKYNLSVQALEQKDLSLESAKKTIEELQNHENEIMLARQREAHWHSSELKSLTNRFSEYKKSVEESIKEKERLVKQLAVKESEIADAKSKLENAEKQHQEWKASIPKLKIEIWNMKQRISELEFSKTNLKKSLDEEQTACSKHGAELAKIKSWNAELDAEKTRLELVIKGYKEELAKDQDDGGFESAIHDRGKASEKLADLQEEIDCLDALNGRRQTQINKLSAELATKQASFDTLAAQLATKTRECAQQAEDMMVYRELTSQDRYDQTTPLIEGKLKAAGLHKDFPVKDYVSLAYFNRTYNRMNNLRSDTMKSAVLSPRDLEPIFWEDGI